MDLDSFGNDVGFRGQTGHAPITFALSALDSTQTSAGRFQPLPLFQLKRLNESA
jgi:hypothetical protein